MNHRLEKLFRAQRGECHFCGKRCHMPPRAGYEHPDSATLDHIFDRHHPLRDSDPREIQLHVMACWTCNQNHVGRIGTPPPGRENLKPFTPIPPLKA
jgi:hypothetical protein